MEEEGGNSNCFLASLVVEKYPLEIGKVENDELEE
jgi:hypothetical protein